MDFAIFNAIYGLANQSRFLNWVGIFLASYLSYVLLIGLVVFFIKYRVSFRFFALLALAFLLSRGLITEVIRLIYSRSRPLMELGIEPLINHSGGGAFPSGHAAAFFVLPFALWLVNKRWGAWYFALVFLMGLARVFVGVHWPMDIVGGALVALLSVIVIKWMLPLRERRKNPSQ